MDKKQIQGNIKIFTKRVQKELRPQKVVLFGSYGYGEITEYSDVDIVVVSEKFKKIPSAKRLDILYEMTKDLYPDFHVFGFTPEEFELTNKLTTLEEVKKRGISLI